MHRPRSFRLLKNLSVVAAVGCLFPTTAGSQEASSNSCSVSVNSPRDGETVGASGDVSGVATIPASDYLWVLAHRKGLVNWWPQGDGPASIDNGAWQVAVTYGVDRDVGRDFEIAVITVGADANARLKEWVDRAARTGNYTPTGFPTTVAGCQIARVTVRKTE